MNGAGRPFARDAGSGLLAALAVYFALQTVLRVVCAHSVGPDEAEILITSQALNWGHGTQPPLYNWLQIAAFELFGTNILALAALKNLLLFATFVFVFLGARIVLRSDVRAGAAASALFTVPQIAWESQRALTHTALVVMLAALTLWVLLRVLRDGRWADYVLLGVCIGLGLLSKYNYGIGAAAMTLAAASVRTLRHRVLSPRMAAALGIAILMVAPHAIWVISHLDDALSRTSKFEAEAGAAFTLVPLGAVLSAALQYGALPLVLFGGCALYRRLRNSSALSPQMQTALQAAVVRIVPIGLALVAVGALLSGTTQVKDRWMGPLLFVLPLVLMILLEPWLGPRMERVLKRLSLVLALAAMAGLSLMYIKPKLGNPPEANRPMPALADQIRALGFERGTIIADRTTLGGGLKAEFPDSPVEERQYGVTAAPAPGLPILLAWEGEAAPPSSIGRLYGEICGSPLSDLTPVRLTAPYEHSTAAFSVHVAVLGPCPAR